MGETLRVAQSDSALAADVSIDIGDGDGLVVVTPPVLSAAKDLVAGPGRGR